MSKIEIPRPAPTWENSAGLRRRLPPLPLMRLNSFAKAGLFGLRLLLGATTAMAGYAALHGLHG